MMLKRQQNSLPWVVLVAIIAGTIWLVIANEGPSALFRFGRPLVRSEGIHIFDPADSRRLVGFGSNVFLGRVARRVSTIGMPTSNPESVIPRTQFEVQVVENIKGNLSGEVIVNQDAGNNGFGQVEISENDALLEPGQTYLFVTKYDKETGWYHIVVPGNANIRVKNDKHRAEVKEKFKKAYKEEIPTAKNSP